MDHVLGQEALSRAGLPLDQQRQRRAGQHLQLAAQLGHAGRPPPEHRPLLRRVRQRQRARDLGRQAAAVDHLVLAQVQQRIGRPLGAQVRAGGGQHDHRQRRVLRAQALEDQQPLAAAQRLQRGPARLGVGRQSGFVLGQQALFGQREVQVQDHQVGQRGHAGQHLGRLGEVVRAAQRATARSLVTHLAGNAPIAAGHRLQVRELAVDHLDGLVAVIDHQQAWHQRRRSIQRSRQPAEGQLQRQHPLQIAGLRGGHRPPDGVAEGGHVGARRGVGSQRRPERGRRGGAPLVVDQRRDQLAGDDRAAHVAPVAGRPDHALHQVVPDAGQPVGGIHAAILQNEICET